MLRFLAPITVSTPGYTFIIRVTDFSQLTDRSSSTNEFLLSNQFVFLIL